VEGRIITGGRAWTFEFAGDEYEIISYNGTDIVRLYVKVPQSGRSDGWAFIYRVRTEGRSARVAADELRQWVTGL
jgi:hypothetical protein